jgi:hypothetical protein
MNKKYLAVLAVLIFIGLFFFFVASFAMEIQYPDINGISITDETTPTVYILYFFSLLVGLGGVIAFIVLVKAGIGFMMAGGEPGKISEAKNQMVGAFVGLILLYSSYLILNTINKNLLIIEVKPMDCSTMNICVEKKILVKGKLKTFEEMSIASANENLVLQPTESIIIKRYVGVKEIWGFNEVGYKGTPIEVYRDSADDLNTVATDIDISSLKSYKIITKAEGFYLYDKPNYEIGDATIAPFFLNGSVEDFNSTNPKFFNKTQSVDSIMPRVMQSPPIYPGAMFFSEPRFSGQCYGTYVDNSDLNQIQPRETVKFGYNVASVIFFHSSSSSSTLETGNVVFYNNLSCNENDESINKCRSFITGSDKPITFKTDCNNSDFKVQSLKLSGSIGVVFMQGDRCQYFDKKDFKNGNCIPTILDSQVPNPDWALLLPVD